MSYSDHIGDITVTGWLETLIDLIFRRLELAEDVAADKFASGRPVDDPARERQILDSVARALVIALRSFMPVLTRPPATP